MIVNSIQNVAGSMLQESVCSIEASVQVCAVVSCSCHGPKRFADEEEEGQNIWQFGLEAIWEQAHVGHVEVLRHMRC